MSEIDKPFTIPDHWKWSTLEAIGVWTGGGTPSKQNSSYWEGDIPWVSPKDMKKLTIHDTEDHVTPKGVRESSAKYIPNGSVLFVTRSSILQHSLPTGIANVDLTVNQDLKALTPVPSLSAKFVLYYTRAATKDILRSCSKSGTTVQSLETSKLYQYPIPVPPATEQQRIVEKIEKFFSNLDAGMTELQTTKQQLERYRQSVLQSAVEGRLTAHWRKTHAPEPADRLLDRILDRRRELWEEKYRRERYDSQGKEPPSGWKDRYDEPKSPADEEELPDLPNGWLWTSLDAVTWNDIDYRGKTPPYSDSGIPTISAGNIKNGEVSFETRKKYVSKETYEEWLTRGEPEPGDLIITTEAPPGRTALLPGDQTYLLTRRVLACQTVYVDNRFLQLCFEIGPTEEHLRGSSRGTTVDRILKKVLFKTPLPLPPLDEQKQIVGEVERLSSVADDVTATTERERSRAVRLRQSILNQAYSGQLVPKDEDTAPVLEKIGNEKTDLEERLESERYALKAEAKSSTEDSEKRQIDLFQQKGDVGSTSTTQRAEVSELANIILNVGEPLAPKELFDRSNTDDIDDFYARLKEEVEVGIIFEVEPDSNTRLLNVKDEN